MESCSKESEIVAAAMSGEMPEALASHTKGCLACSEALIAARCLQVAAIQPFDSPMPLAGIVWWKAAFDQRRRARWRVKWITRSAYVLAFLVSAPLIAPQAALLAHAFAIWAPYLEMLGYTIVPIAFALFSWSRVIARERL
jgi:hypothetical protein